MGIVTRGQKGSKLTIQEMDGNLIYLDSRSTSANTGLSTEITQRISSDNSISNKLTTEVSQRISTELSLSTAISQGGTGGGGESFWENSTMQQKSIKYGRLYNWYAATDVRGIAPVGWHVPSYTEFQTLINFCGGINTAQYKLKSTDSNYWNHYSGDPLPTNDYNFMAVGSGARYFYNNLFGELNDGCYLWSASNDGNGYPGIFRLFPNKLELVYGYDKMFGFSIRLIKDNSTNEGDVIIDGDTYHSVTIGDQVWLQQNLAETHYQNGDLIGSDFSGTVGAVTAYNNDESNVYNIVTITDPIHIQPKDNKRINANIIDGLTNSDSLWEEVINGKKYTDTYYDWDSNSSKWIPNGKQETTYNNSDQDILEEYYNFNVGDSSWTLVYRGEYTYDSNNNQILDIKYNWDDELNKLINYEKSINAYDDRNNEILHESYEWDIETSSWVGSRKYVYAYDHNNNPDNNENSKLKSNISIPTNVYNNKILSASYLWDSNISDWIGKNKYEYAFDSNNNKILDASYSWDSNISDWVGQQKNEYAFDYNNNEILYAEYSWDSNTSDWIGDYKNEYIYDSNNNSILEAEYSWDYNTSNWVGDGKTEYEYDSNNSIILQINYYWDSNISDWNYDSKREYTYDSNNNEILNVQYSWDSDTSNWITVGKYEYTYDTNNNRLSEIDYYWDSNNSVWEFNYKYEYTYTNNNLILEVDYTWGTNISGITYWENTIKYEYEYDSNNNEILNIISAWNNYYSLWIYNNKYESAYDSNNNRILDVSYFWDSNTSNWIGSQKREYAYDSNNNETLNTYYTWNTTTSNWIGYYKYEYAYDSNNNKILDAGYSWDSNTSNWIGNQKYISTYDSNNNQLLYSYYTWNYNTSNWIGYYKYESAFDSNNNQLLYSYYTWNTTTSNWIYSSKEEYTYDSNNNQLLSTYYTWNTTTSNWIYSSKEEYTYDSNNEQILSINYSWESNISDWVYSSKNESVTSNTNELRPKNNDLVDAKYIKNLPIVSENPGGGTVSVINVTYSELTNLISANGLKPLQNYLITDYQTVHRIPNTSDINTGDIEPLLVTSISRNKLKPEAYSSLFPQDVIYYNHINDQTIAPGCTMGYIYRRIDTTQNNDICFDFRQAKFRRWEINVTNVWESGITYDINDVVTYNDYIYVSLSDNNSDDVTSIYWSNPTNSTNWLLYPFKNLTYSSYYNYYSTFNIGGAVIPITSNYQDYTMWGNWNHYYNSINNTIFSYTVGSYENMYSFNTVILEGNFYNNTIYGGNNEGSTGQSSMNNTISGFCYNNIIYGGFSGNIIGREFYNNTIKNRFSGNLIEGGFYNNSIGSNFSSNTVGSAFFDNTIGSYFDANTLGSNFYDNNIGSDFQYNSIKKYFSYNTIDSYFQNNSTGNSFGYNSIGYMFDRNDMGDDFQNNSIRNNFNNNIIGSGFQMNNVSDNFNSNGGLDFTSSDYVYNQYSKELFITASQKQILKYTDEFDDIIFIDLPIQ